MKLVLPLRYVAVGAVVTKPTGDKLYVVRDSIKLHGAQPSEIKAEDGVRFLVDRDGNISSLPANMQVAIHGDVIALFRVLRDIARSDRDLTDALSAVEASLRSGE